MISFEKVLIKSSEWNSRSPLSRSGKRLPRPSRRRWRDLLCSNRYRQQRHLAHKQCLHLRRSYRLCHNPRRRLCFWPHLLFDLNSLSNRQSQFQHLVCRWRTPQRKNDHRRSHIRRHNRGKPNNGSSHRSRLVRRWCILRPPRTSLLNTDEPIQRQRPHRRHQRRQYPLQSPLHLNVRAKAHRTTLQHRPRS